MISRRQSPSPALPPPPVVGRFCIHSSARRRATFALAVACLFGSSASLSSSSQKRTGKVSATNNGVSLPSLESQYGGTGRSHNRNLLNQTLGEISVSQRLLLSRQNSNNNSGDDGYDDDVSLVDSFQQIRKAVLQELRQDNNFNAAKVLICGMLDYLKDCADDSDSDKNANAVGKHAILPEERRLASESIDEALQAFYARAFATPFRGKKDFLRVELGVELLQQQFHSSGILPEPFDTVPKRIIVQALAAVTTLQERQRPSASSTSRSTDIQQAPTSSSISPDVAFRLLQRLVTGVGIRKQYSAGNSDKGRKHVKTTTLDLYEVDFNRVLNVYSNLGKMDMAHRVIALQERTPHAPALSPVTYSILVKGYGKLGDWNNIDMLLQHAAASGVAPDTILFNSFMDAYINCKQLKKARQVFHAMTGDVTTSRTTRKKDEFPFAVSDCPPPNLRTYNTLLKGLAQAGDWDEAECLATRMKDQLKLWDHITTNTLVQAAAGAGEFPAAEAILNEHTVIVDAQTKKQCRRHPNADAYTSLIDGYCKSGLLDRAVSLMKTMTDRGVEPNEFHLSSLIGGLARQKRVVQARKILSHVKVLDIASNDQRPIYNAFISGLVHHDKFSADDNYDKYIDEALRALRDMMEAKVSPDVKTVAVLLDGFGQCQTPRVVEATMLVKKLEEGRIIPRDHVIVSTSLIRVFAAAGDLEDAKDAFQRIRHPDIAAVNSFLDAVVRCGDVGFATETFERFFWDKKARLSPDVISYTTLINAHLKKGTFDGSRTARNLYNEMKYERRIFPDTSLIDTIIRGMVENSRTIGVQAADARFLAGTLRDAEELAWGDGQLAQRKRVVELAMSKQMAWEEESSLYGLRSRNVLSSATQQDAMFQRHGWNEVDSGFQLWGAGRKATDEGSNTDEFLKSKGWNDMNSGFRII